MNPHRSTLAGRLFMRVVYWLLTRRYRITVTGLDAVRARGTEGVVFLPNHPAVGDPAAMLALLWADFAPRSLADEYQVDRPVIRTLARWLGARTLPNLERSGVEALEGTRRALAETIEGLKQGENLLLYPAGHSKRTYLEEIGAASGVKTILDAVPNVRVVLVRMNGVWGSSFSRAFTGRPPDFGRMFARALRYLLLNGILFMPRRPVTIEFVEPADLPRDADRMTLNAYLERFYNENASPNIYVPYGFWERGGIRQLPEPAVEHIEGDVSAVPDTLKQQVVDEIARLTGKTSIAMSDDLARDLGLDSLATAELIVWIQREFGFSIGTPESLRTVSDVVLAAAGKGISAYETDIRPAPPWWFSLSRSEARITVPEGTTITEVFLKRAATDPRRVIVADQTSGVRSYQDLVTAILVLKPLIEQMPGQYVGIMLPASVAAGVFYLTCLFAGKIPVMVNWTTGSRNLVHGLDLLGVQKVITARALLTRLETLGITLDVLSARLVAAEDLRARITLSQKLRAAARSHLSWRALAQARPASTAVVLFTSGSESLPKAVPLSHENLLTNIRDTLTHITVRDRDVLVGMLPPFHSFGITVTTVLPLCSGLRTVYHPNPTEAGILAHLVEAYGVTLLVGTPTFLSGIVRAARPGQLNSLRLAVTGAEKCPPAVYDLLERRCPHLTVIEGYGITECSPVVSANRVEAPVKYSIGSLLPSVDGVVVDLETGRRVDAGTKGMLLVRGPSVFAGYLQHEGESPFVDFDGRTWYRTGDLVRQDAAGVLFFEGRLKRFVKIGGEMISLPAIESALEPYFPLSDDEPGPCIAAEALGDPEHPELVLFTTRQVDRAVVNGWLREAGLSPLYHIRRVIVVPAIPVLGTGKTDYRALKEQYS